MPVDKEVVKNQLEALGDFHKFFTSKEIHCLHDVLNPGEQIKAITSGYYESKTWVVVVTTLRLIFLDKGMFYGLKQLDMPLHHIGSVSQHTGFLMGEIEVTTNGGSKTIGCIPKKDVTKVANILSAEIYFAQNPKARQAAPSAEKPAPALSSASLADELERLAELYRQGVLDEMEFSAGKAKILGMESKLDA